MQWTPFQYVLYLLDGARFGKRGGLFYRGTPGVGLMEGRMNECTVGRMDGWMDVDVKVNG